MTDNSKWRNKITVPIILVSGIIVFLVLTLSKSNPDHREIPTIIPIVETVLIKSTTVPVVIEAMGGVKPAQSVKIVPQVNGKIIYINPNLIPGGMVKKGDLLIRIDTSDYDLAIREAKAAVTQAQLAVEEQEGMRSAAEKELQLVGEDIALTMQGRRLASRETYVENAHAQLDAAKSRLEKAQLNRSRTAIYAPFNARVSEENVDIGQIISTQFVAATLIASNEAWVEATLPVERLQWMDIPGVNSDKGSSVLIRQKLSGDIEITREGEVLNLLPGIEGKGKLARLLIKVDNPFAEKKPKAEQASPNSENENSNLPLLVGSFVRVEIHGHTLENLFELPRVALREDNRVWVKDGNGLLVFRNVKVIWTDDTTIFVRGELNENETVITSRLTTPLPGMKVQTAEENKAFQKTISHTKKKPARPHKKSSGKEEVHR